jgi:hypothetical protein
MGVSSPLTFPGFAAYGGGAGNHRIIANFFLALCFPVEIIASEKLKSSDDF